MATKFVRSWFNIKERLLAIPCASAQFSYRSLNNNLVIILTKPWCSYTIDDIIHRTIETALRPLVHNVESVCNFARISTGIGRIFKQRRQQRFETNTTAAAQTPRSRAAMFPRLLHLFITSPPRWMAQCKHLSTTLPIFIESHIYSTWIDWADVRCLIMAAVRIGIMVILNKRRRPLVKISSTLTFKV